MNAVEFLSGPVAELPRTRSESYPEFVDRIFKEYQVAITRIKPTHSLEAAIKRQLPKICGLADAIREVIRLAVAGDLTAAFSGLTAALYEVRHHLSMLMPRGDKSSLINPMYRFRRSGSEPYQKRDLFHIPFHLRQIVEPMRYSVAGQPSLYLGGSTQVCWLEIGQPNLGTISVSRFEAIPGTGLKVLNFGFRPRILAAMINEFPELYEGDSNGTIMVLAHVACWPLIAACSVRVPDRNAPDRPEYLLPQLILQWLTRTHEYHGLRYFSTHYTAYPDDPKTYMNYVFPAKQDAESGYCADLCGLFELSDPVSWDQAKAAPLSQMNRPLYQVRAVVDDQLEAEFGRAEDGLLSLPVGRLEPWVVLPIHTARHEAAHAVFCWVTGVPFDSVHFGGQQGTDHAGYLVQNSDAVHWVKARTGNRQNVIQQLIVRLLGAHCIAEIFDIKVNNLPPNVAAVRAGCTQDGELKGDCLNSEQVMDDFNLQAEVRSVMLDAAKNYANQFVDEEWFRSAVVAVGKQLLTQQTMSDFQVGETIAASLSGGGRLPVPPEPAREQIEFEAFCRWWDTGRVFGYEDVHWHSARKGIRFLRECERQYDPVR